MSYTWKQWVLAIIGGFAGGALWTITVGALMVWAHSGVVQ